MALRQIAWTEGASLQVDLDNQGRVQALECWAAPTRDACVTIYKDNVVMFTNDPLRDPQAIPTAAGTQQRWDVPQGKKWTYDQLTDSEGFGAELRLM